MTPDMTTKLSPIAKETIATFPILRVEVTVAMAVTGPDDRIVGDNVVDATLAFGWKLTPIPDGVTEEAIVAVLGTRVGPVLALVESALVLNGWVVMGQVEDPMVAGAKPTGRDGHTGPITVHVLDEAMAVHD